MIQTASLFVLSSAFLLGVRVPAYSQTRDLYPNAPDELIQKRASQQAKPIWQIPLGPALIEDLQSIQPGRLLVSLRKDFPGLPNLDILLVDAAKGQILWRYSREKLKGQYDCLLALQDVLLFRVDRGKSVSLLALDAQRGVERWTVNFEGEQVTFIPFISGGAALAINPDARAVTLTAVDLEGGRTLWQRSFKVPHGADLPAPQASGEGLYVFYTGLERLSPLDGKSIFARPDIVFDADCPPPQFEQGTLWAIHSGVRLSAMDPESGKERWTASLPGGVHYTNIYPLGEKIYLRGIDSLNTHHLHALRRADATNLWTYKSKEPNLSNLVESRGTLFFGSPTSLVALNSGDGNEVFRVQVTTTGRSFPIRLREFDDRIVYIGELVAAAFDATTGNLVYKQGTTPSTGELHLNGLDDAAPNLKEELKKSFQNPAGGFLISQAGFATAEMTRYQNLANTYRSQADNYFNQRDNLGGSVASLKQSMAQHRARLEAMKAFAYSAVNVGILIRQFFNARSIKTAIERQELFRKSILASYVQAETAEHFYRPHLVFRDPADTFSTISIVHLPTGRRNETVLSPQYLSYGLWQVVDFEKEVVYHCNIGLDPARYELSESRAYYPYSKARTIQTFLIAQPVKIPR